MADPSQTGFVIPTPRENVTHEPERSAKKWTPEFPDVNWIGFNDMAPPAVLPADFHWGSSPKQRQEEYGSSVGRLPEPSSESKSPSADERVEEASRESFPASDPPAWIPSTMRR